VQLQAARCREGGKILPAARGGGLDDWKRFLVSEYPPTVEKKEKKTLIRAIIKGELTRKM